MRKSLALVALALAGLAGNTGCSGGSSNAPTPVATPTPAPTPTPTPTPMVGCGLASMPDCAAPEGPRGVYGCCRQRTDELGEFVELAIRDVQASRPELFEGDRIKDADDVDLIISLIVRDLEQRFQLCAKQTSNDEIAVKRINDFSEQYDVIIGDGLAVNVHGYAVTCRPARF